MHTTIAAFTFQKNYVDYTQRPGAVIPNACIKYVSVPSIGQGQNAGNGLAHTVAACDNICVGGGYTCYLDTTYSKVSATASMPAIGTVSATTSATSIRLCQPAARAIGTSTMWAMTMCMSVTAAASIPPPATGSNRPRKAEGDPASAVRHAVATDERLQLLIGNLHEA